VWQGVKEDVRDSIWIGRPVYDKFGRKGEIISDMWGALDGSTQFNYRVWVIRLDAGGTIQVENAVNFGVPQPFDESGILYFDGDNWVALSEHPDTAYGISLKQAEFPNVSGHPDYQAVLKDDSWLRQPVVKPPFEPAKDGTISLENLLDMARRNTKIFGDLSNQSVACLEPIHEWLDKNYDEYVSGSTKRLQELKDNGEQGGVEELEAYIGARQAAYDHNKHLLKEHSKLACDIFQAFLTNVEDEYANPENYDWFCRESWPQRTRLAPSSPCPSVPEFLGYYVANEGVTEVLHNWFEYEPHDFIDEYIMNQYQIPAEQQDLDVDMDFHDERNECYDLLRLIEDYSESNLEEIVFEAYYGDEASDMLKEFRERHYEAETFQASAYDYRERGVRNRYTDEGRKKQLAMQFGLDGEGFESRYEPFMFFFDEKGIKQIANVATRYPYNQQQFAQLLQPSLRRVISQKTSAGLHGTVIFLNDVEAKTVQRLWKNHQYCRLYRKLKRYALSANDRPPMRNLTGQPTDAESFYERMKKLELYMELECNDAARIDHASRGLMNWDSFTRDDYEAETFQADQFGTSSLEGFAYYDRLPDLGNPKTINSDISNIAAPFAVVFDNKGVRSIANVGIKENQMQLGGQMTLAHSKSNMSYFMIYLRPMQVKKVETMWYKGQYCELYLYLKDIALTEEGAFAGQQGEINTKAETATYFNMRKIRTIEAIQKVDCQDQDDEEPSLLGLFNWFNRFSAETFHAFDLKDFQDKPLWERQILLDYPDKMPNRSREIGYNDTRKCAKCAKWGGEVYGAKVSQYNDGLRIYQYDDCGCWVYDHSIRNRRHKKVRKLRSQQRQKEYREQQLEKQELERYREQQQKDRKKWWQFWR
tara:strand:- start:10184 stop:12805 length:2622 start_codon:yes stop_codon:yes gene_type:complete